MNLFLKSKISQPLKAPFSFFCPFCAVERRLKSRPDVNRPKYVFQVGLTSAVVTLIGWSWLGWKGLVSFIPLWIGFEIIYRLNTRTQLVCPDCGFDPFLYLADLKKARSQIEMTLKQRYTAPAQKSSEAAPAEGESSDVETSTPTNGP